MQSDPLILAAIAGIFLLAGTVKGVIGLGLPTVTLGLATLLLDLTSAMALLVVPSLVTNIWQAAVGGYGRTILARIWPFLAAATATVWIGALALAQVDLTYLSALLGLLLVAYAATGLAGARLTFTEQQARWSGPVFGGINGVLTGMTGSFMVPGVLYLQALGMPRDMLVQAMGMLFTLSTAALALALGQSNLVTAELGTASALGLLPAILGMLLGQRIRHGLSEQRFRQVFFLGVLGLGITILWRAFFS